MFDSKQHSYQAFRSVYAERTSQIVAVVGSGFSVAAGLPDWARLRSLLLEALRDKARHLEGEEKTDLLDSLGSIREQEPKIWIQFERLRSTLGRTTYRETIKTALASAHAAEIPEGYLNVWQLSLQGVITLNLDRLATRAHSSTFPGKHLIEMTGRQAASNPAALKSPHRFVINLHGTLEDEQSWVFTHQDLNELRAVPGYKEFLSIIFAGKTVLFLGVRADDLAVGGHLEELSGRGISVGSHFWVTDRRDREAIDWAERAGVRLIHYRSDGDDHSDVQELLTDLRKYTPTEPAADPVVLDHPESISTPVPPPDELKQKSEEEIRKILNMHASDILRPGNQGAYEEYQEFMEKYDLAFYRAWYVTDREPNNLLLGYRLLDKIGEGAFGTVYRADSPEGEEVAVKVLHERVRHAAEMLQGFRRGVRSMRILAKRKVEGMVPYRAASEIPAFVVMDLVQGPNLKTAVESGYLDTWVTKIRIARELADIIHTAHRLPERVLHRDIRPSNIMLKGYYEDPLRWKIVVLDFDLSWHVDAFEKSIREPRTNIGYLAPEQLEVEPEFSRRSAGVDSYGLGMTLYYMLAGKDPIFNQTAQATWFDELMELAAREPCAEWQSLPSRFARLIYYSTRVRQPERWDFGQICGELERLEAAIKRPSGVTSSEFIAEEIFARSDVGGYGWEADGLSVSLELPSGLTVRLKPNEAAKEIDLVVGWLSQGQYERKKIGRWLPLALQSAKGILEAGGWQKARTSKSGQSGTLTATIRNAEALDRGLDFSAAKLARIAELLRFE